MECIGYYCRVEQPHETPSQQFMKNTKIPPVLDYVAGWLERDLSPLYLTSPFLIAPLNGHRVPLYEVAWLLYTQRG